MANENDYQNGDSNVIILRKIVRILQLAEVDLQNDPPTPADGYHSLLVKALKALQHQD